MLTKIWRLSGLTGSEVGHLESRGGRLIYMPIDKSRPGFDVSLAEVSDVSFPWHYLGGGFKMRIGGEQFRFSFIEPHNEAADISSGREAGKAWRRILVGS